MQMCASKHNYALTTFLMIVFHYFLFATSDQAFEVTALLAEFQAVRACDQLIHTRSGFATQLYEEMRAAGKEDVDRIDLSEQGKVFSLHHKNTTHISEAYDVDKLQDKLSEK
jgi:hypothetical protein